MGIWNSSNVSVVATLTFKFIFLRVENTLLDYLLPGHPTLLLFTPTLGFPAEMHIPFKTFTV